MSLAILFHFLCTQHVSDINISIIRSLRLFCWITTLVVLFFVRCVLEFRLQPATRIPFQPNRTETPTHMEPKNNTNNVIIQQNSRKLLMMDILMSETCWVHKKWNKIASGIKLVFYSSPIVCPECVLWKGSRFSSVAIKSEKWETIAEIESCEIAECQFVCGTQEYLIFIDNIRQ